MPHFREWLCILSMIAALVAATSLCADPPAGRPTAQIVGEVLARDGKPVVGARVTVWMAFPIEGPAYYCPSCYVDCGRSTSTDEVGRFVIDQLDDSLKFSLLVTHDGHVPLRTAGSIDPRSGQLAGDRAIRLTPRDWAQFKPSQVVAGSVVNERGTPIAGAVVEAWEVHQTDGRGGAGAVDGLDPLAVTDAQGRFRIAFAKEDAAALSITITARARARGVFRKLATGGQQHVLTLTEGASVAGKLVKNGAPIPGIELGIYLNSRRIEDGAHEQRIATNEQGRFTFTNLPPGKEYWLYTKMNSTRERGAVATQLVTLGADGSVADVGDIELAEGLVVAGRLESPGGLPVPQGNLILGNTHAWDSQVASIKPDGRFQFIGVPAGEYDLYFAADDRSLRISDVNASSSGEGSGRLTGAIARNKLDMVVRLEPSIDRPRRFLQPWEKPLVGAEGSVPLAALATPTRQAAARAIPVIDRLAGRVVDEHGSPIDGALVRVVLAAGADTGRSINGLPHPALSRMTRTDASGGFDLTELGAVATLWLAASADGFVGKVFKHEQLRDACTLELRRRDAANPPSRAVRGRVFDDQGNPLAGAIVSCVRGALNAEYRSFVGGSGEGEPQSTTDNQGRFTLAVDPKHFAVGLHILAAEHALGMFQWITFDPAEQEFRLVRGSTIRGRVVSGGQPVPGARVVCATTYPNRDSAVPVVEVLTGDDGAFQIPHVPPKSTRTVYAVATDGRVSTPVTLVADPEGKETSAGVLELQPGLRLAGRVGVRFGEVMPARGVWVIGLTVPHTQFLPVDSSGTFSCSGLPPGAYALNPSRGEGAWIISAANKGLPWPTAECIVGVLAADKLDCVLLMEPWTKPPDRTGRPPPRPLRGTEPEAMPNHE